MHTMENSPDIIFLNQSTRKKLTDLLIEEVLHKVDLTDDDLKLDLSLGRIKDPNKLKKFLNPQAELLKKIAQLAATPECPLFSLDILAGALADIGKDKNDQERCIAQVLSQDDVMPTEAFESLVNKLIPAYFLLTDPMKGEEATLFRNENKPAQLIVMGLMQAMIKNEEFVRVILEPRFTDIAFLVMKCHLFEGKFELKKIEKSLKKITKNYLVELASIEKNTDTVPETIRKNCNLVLSNIMDLVFKDGRISENPCYDNPDYVRFDGKINGKRVKFIPKAALGFLLLYLNLRLMVLFIDLFEGKLRREGLRSIFSRTAIEDGIAKFIDKHKKNKSDVCKKLEEVLEKDTSIHEEFDRLKKDGTFFEEFSRLLAADFKSGSAKENHFLMYAVTFFEIDENKEKKSNIIDEITISIRTTLQTCIVPVAESLRVKNLPPLARKSLPHADLARKMYNEIVIDYTQTYVDLCVALTKKEFSLSPEVTVQGPLRIESGGLSEKNMSLPKDDKKESQKLQNSPSSSRTLSASASASDDDYYQKSSETDIDEMGVDWQPLMKELARAKTGADLSKIVDSAMTLLHDKFNVKFQSLKSSEGKSEITGNSNVNQTSVLFKMNMIASADSADVATTLKAMLHEQKYSDKVKIRKIFANPSKKLEALTWWQGELKGCVATMENKDTKGMFTKAIYLKTQLKPLFFYVVKTLTEKRNLEGEAISLEKQSNELIEIMQSVVTEAKIDNDFKKQLRAELKLDNVELLGSQEEKTKCTIM